MRASRHRRAQVGVLGEAAAREELTRLGYRIRHRNYRCPAGEADVVADEGGALVFVEVKTRSTLRHGLPAEAVGWRKRRRLEETARHYCAEHELEELPVRFDVVEVVLVRGEIAAVRVLADAFGGDE